MGALRAFILMPQHYCSTMINMKVQLIKREEGKAFDDGRKNAFLHFLDARDSSRGIVICVPEDNIFYPSEKWLVDAIYSLDLDRSIRSNGTIKYSILAVEKIASDNV